MSRIIYDEWDEEDWGLRAGRWFGRVRSSFLGRKGQNALRETEAALLALPQKRLIANELCDGSDVCVLGAVGLVKGITAKDLQGLGELDCDEISEWAEKNLGFKPTLAWVLHEWNDEDFGFLIPEERYSAILQRIRDWLANPQEQYHLFKEQRLL